MVTILQISFITGCGRFRRNTLDKRGTTVDIYAYSNFPSIPPSPQAQLVDQRSELTEVKAEREVMEREVHDQLLQLHSLQLQLYAKQGQAEDSDTIKDRLVCRTRENVPMKSH